MRPTPVAVAGVGLLLAVTGIAVAVQQRGVAATWRSLEQQRQRAAAHTLADQGRQLVALRKERNDLQTKLDVLAAKRAAGGDQAAAVSVLAARGDRVRDRLVACANPLASDVTTAASCAVAADEAQQILDSLTRVAAGR
jgi:hypothetical protein